MYYISYGFYYLLSLIPWRVMFLLADAFYVLVYYVFGYRKPIVMKNLSIAFPEKTEAERIRIAKDFYHNFIDMIFETIKMFSISNQELQKRFSTNIEVLNDLFDSGQNVQLECGHFFNWEIINLGLGLISKYPFIGVYQPLSNKVMNRIMLQMRQKNGTILIPASDFRTNFSGWVKNRYALGLAADQNPPNEFKAHWVNFFGRLTPFIVGPEKGAKDKNTAIVFCHFYKTKRGYYRADMELLTTTPNEYKVGALTQIFATHVENSVKKTPSNYLWTHRRWKWEFDQEKHGHLKVS